MIKYFVCIGKCMSILKGVIITIFAITLTLIFITEVYLYMTHSNSPKNQKLLILLIAFISALWIILYNYLIIRC